MTKTEVREITIKVDTSKLDKALNEIEGLLEDENYEAIAKHWAIRLLRLGDWVPLHEEQQSMPKDEFNKQHVFSANWASELTEILLGNIKEDE